MKEKMLGYLVLISSLLSCTYKTILPPKSGIDLSKIGYVATSDDRVLAKVNSNNLLIYNPGKLSQYSKETQEFILWHEVGHLDLGHLERNITKDEAQKEADCYAKLKLDEQGKTPDYKSLEQVIGNKRVKDLFWCYK